MTSGTPAYRVLQCINFTVKRLNLPPGLVGLLLGLPQSIIVALCRLSQISKLQKAKDEVHIKKHQILIYLSVARHCVSFSLPTLDLYHSSDSCIFFKAMVSYWALISLRAPVRSGLELLSTSIFSCWVWTLTCTSWISWWRIKAHKNCENHFPSAKMLFTFSVRNICVHTIVPPEAGSHQ